MEIALKMIKALSDKNRLRIIMVLMQEQELCLCQITALLKLASATVSRHLSILQNADLVQNRKNGRWVHYSLSNSFPEQLKVWLSDSLTQSKEMLFDREEAKKIALCDLETFCKKK